MMGASISRLPPVSAKERAKEPARDPAKEPAKEPANFSKFTLFPDLPTELRLKIWEFSALAPRTVVLSGTPHPRSGHVWPYKCITKPPAGLSVCLESRAEYLKAFQLLPTTSHCPSPMGGCALIYFAHDRDTLEIPGRSLLSYCPSQRPREKKTPEQELVLNGSQHIGWYLTPFENLHACRLRINIYNLSAFEVQLLLLNISMTTVSVESVTFFIHKDGTPRARVENGLSFTRSMPYYFYFDIDSVHTVERCWEEILPQVNICLHGFVKTLTKWKTVAYTSSGEITPKPKYPFEGIVDLDEQDPLYEARAANKKAVARQLAVVYPKDLEGIADLDEQHLLSEAPAATTAVAIPSAVAPLSSYYEEQESGRNISGVGPCPMTPQELIAAVPIEGITPEDLMHRLNQTRFQDLPYLDLKDFLDHNGARGHLAVGRDGLLKPIGSIKLILEWA